MPSFSKMLDVGEVFNVGRHNNCQHVWPLWHLDNKPFCLPTPHWEGGHVLPVAVHVSGSNPRGGYMYPFLHLLFSIWPTAWSNTEMQQARRDAYRMQGGEVM